MPKSHVKQVMSTAFSADKETETMSFSKEHVNQIWQMEFKCAFLLQL